MVTADKLSSRDNLDFRPGIMGLFTAVMDKTSWSHYNL